MPYRRDTLQPVFSATKGVVAVAANMLVDRGRLDLDAPVANYWPEFARNGKGGIPVRWLLTHQAGLAVIDRPLTLDELLSWDPVVDGLAEQAPNWEPGTRHGYHSLTYGFLVGELVRRTTGLTVGEWLAQEVAIPLCAEFFIGLPSRLDGRVARFLPFPKGNGGLAKFTEPGPDSLPYRAVSFVQPPLVPELVNEPKVRRAQLPSFNGISTARALARIWAALIGDVDGVQLLSTAAMEAARAEQVRGPDLIRLGLHRDRARPRLPAP